MSFADYQYEMLLRQIYHSGAAKEDRTGVGTRSLFGQHLRFSLRNGFPLVTTKKVHFKSVVTELLWLLRGDTNIAFLHEHGCTIWDEWASSDGELGPIYGKQWRRWQAPDGREIDQIQNALDLLKNNPDSRRILVSAWNPADLADMALEPCHVLFQFYVANGFLSCQVYQRSCDVFLGVPFNIASYALLTHMMAQQAGLGVGWLCWTGGDCHIYNNHMEQVAEQLSRKHRTFPTLELDKAPDLFSYTHDHIRVVGYDPHPPISAPVAI